ncbi:hypothetical protein ACIQU8_02170 [Streptomyces griseus]|uniref:hypothetical protein n=1 Tax=Streptomyces griseus TaxID=1911 RepID=UPI00382A93BA
MFGSGLPVNQWWILASVSAFLPGLAMLPYIRKAKKKAVTPLFFIVPGGVGAVAIAANAAARDYGLAESLELFIWCMAGLALLIVLGRPQIKRNERLQARGEPMEQPSPLYLTGVFVSLGVIGMLAAILRNHLIG